MFHQDRITHLRLCGSELYADNYVCMLRDWTVVDFTVDVPQRFKLLTNHVRVAVDDCSVTLHQYHVNFASRDVDKRFVRRMHSCTPHAWSSSVVTSINYNFYSQTFTF